MAQIRESLLEFNPWWQGAFGHSSKGREVFAEILKFFGKRQIISLCGLRRTGKTTLMLRLVDMLLRNGFDAKKILFFSFDEFPDADIRSVISEFESLFSYTEKRGYHVFFDEIQKVDGWEAQLKTFYDLNPEMRITISGSESLFIRSKSKETLAGRIFEFRVEPLSFGEFLSFKGEESIDRRLAGKELRTLFQEFMLTQGFPQLIGETENPEFIKKYLMEGIVDKVLYKDLQRMFRIRDMAGFESVAKIIMNEPGRVIEANSLSKELGLQRAVVSNYLNLLEKSFLVRRLFNYSKSIRKSSRKLKKYYPAILTPPLLYAHDSHAGGIAFESFLVNCLKAEFFWRDQYKNEVDVVLAAAGPLPVEIKSGKIGTKGITEFMRKFGVEKGIILTLSEEGEVKEKAGTIKIMPAWKWLLEKNQ